MAKQPLGVGKRVWIETADSFVRAVNNERRIHEYEVVEVNKSSAYAVSVDRLDKYNENPKQHTYLKRRIEQRTHNIKSDGLGSHFVLWLTPESFEKNVHYNKVMKETRKQAHEVVDKMPLSELKKLINQFN